MVLVSLKVKIESMHQLLMLLLTIHLDTAAVTVCVHSFGLEESRLITMTHHGKGCVLAGPCNVWQTQ